MNMGLEMGKVLQCSWFGNYDLFNYLCDNGAELIEGRLMVTSYAFLMAVQHPKDSGADEFDIEFMRKELEEAGIDPDIKPTEDNKEDLMDHYLLSY
jgi:hypothetical protein